MNKLFSVSKRCVCLIICLMIIFSVCFVAQSTGSREMIANGGFRPYLEYNVVDTQAGVPRKSVINIYLKKGESLYFGSSVPNSKIDINDNILSDNPYDGVRSNVDIVLIKPDGTKSPYNVCATAFPTWEGNDKGFIKTIAQEQAGPNYDGSNPDGYTPLKYTATSDGIYQLLFHSYIGKENNNIEQVVKPDEEWFTGNSLKQGSTGVAAWDATVVGTDGHIKNGRVFTKSLFLYPHAVERFGGEVVEAPAVNSVLHVVTNDGYIYETDFNGMIPWGFLFFANNRGLVSMKNNYPLYKSYISKLISGNSDQLADLKNQDVTFHNPFEPDTELDKTHLIFFDKPDPELEGVLYPKAYEPEAPKNFKFIGTAENETFVGGGGYFEFDVTNSTNATVTIDMTAIGRGIVELSNAVTPGTNRFYWDGCDANGQYVPADTYTTEDIKITVETRNGEIHFPLVDVEMMPNGIKITRINNIYKEIERDGVIYNEDITHLYEDKKSYIYYDNLTRMEAIDEHYNTAHQLADMMDCSKDGVDSSNGAMAYINEEKPKDILWGYGDQTALDVWTYLYAENALKLEYEDPITITNEKLTTLTGHVFYDNIYTDLNATDNLFNLWDHDFSLPGIRVQLEYSYYDEYSVLQSDIIETVTDSKGKYYFNVPIMTNGNQTECTITVLPPLDSYTLTTASTTTNDALTLGTEIQQLTLGGFDGATTDLIYKPLYNLSDVGYNYRRTSKAIDVKKDWVNDISSDANRPLSVELTIEGYYLDEFDARQTVTQYEFVLNQANGWQLHLTDLPAWCDVDDENAETLPELEYEIIKEIYTLRDGSQTVTITSPTGDISDKPYNTSFTKTVGIDTITLTAVNAPWAGSIQITKRDFDDNYLLLEGVKFQLWKETELDSIPDENAKDYLKHTDGIVYQKHTLTATNQSGVITFKELSPAKYLVQEVQAYDQSYKLIDKIYEFTVTAANENFYTPIYNEKKKFIVNVKKVDGNTKAPLSDAEFTLFSDAQCTEPIVMKASTLDKNEQNAIAAFTNLTLGSYYLKETAAPNGYLCPSNVITIEVGADDITVTPEGGASAVLQPDANYTVSLEISNFLGVTFPQTGAFFSARTVTLFGFGLCILALVTTVFVQKRLKDN